MRRGVAAAHHPAAVPPACDKSQFYGSDGRSLECKGSVGPSSPLDRFRPLPLPHGNLRSPGFVLKAPAPRQQEEPAREWAGHETASRAGKAQITRLQIGIQRSVTRDPWRATRSNAAKPFSASDEIGTKQTIGSVVGVGYWFRVRADAQAQDLNFANS